MTHAAFIWALAATFLSGIQVFAQKVTAHERRDSALNGIIGFSLAALISGAVLLGTSELPQGWPIIAGISVCAGMMLCLSSYFRIESLKSIDSVIYFPVSKVLGPLVVVVLGITLLHEELTLLQFFGVIFSIFVPLILISSTEKHRQKNLALGLMLLIISTLLAAGTAPMQKVVTNLSANLFFPLFVWLTTAAIGSLALYAILSRSRRSVEIDKKDLKLGALNGVFQFASAFAFIKAVSLGQVSIFYVIHAHYILIPIILSVFYYDEHINLRKFAAIVLSFAAISLLAL
jgi:drug/metabolite transporter (DMT)-like permease